MSRIKLDRGSTNFTLQLFEYLKGISPESKYSFLKYYQNIVREYMNNVDIDSRGLLIKLEMGMGKSICAVSLAMDMMKERQPIILLTKSLQANMRSSIHKYVRIRYAVEPDYALGRLSEFDLDAWIDRNFSFVSMNASNMLTQMSRAVTGKVSRDMELDEKIGKILQLNLDGKLLIVDEAHNLFRAITNGSGNAIGLYDAIMKSRDLKIAFLTGTPIANDPFELVPCFNMLGSKTPGTLTLPEFYKDFYTLYVDREKNIINNRGKFQNRIFGLVSSVTHHSKPGSAAGITDMSAQIEFPEALPVELVKVPMTPEQYAKYLLARDREKEEGLQRGRMLEAPSLQKPKSSKSSSYRVRSRQISNYSYTDDDPSAPIRDPAFIPLDKTSSPKFAAMYDRISVKHAGQLGMVYSQFVGMGGLGVLAAFLRHNSWQLFTLGDKPDASDPGELDEVPEELITHATLPTEAPTEASVGAYDDSMEYLKHLEQEASGSSWWTGGNYGRSKPAVVTVNTTTVMSTHVMPTHVMPTGSFDIMEFIGGASSQVSRRFAIISGRISAEDRARIQDVYNSPENEHGEIIALLLISATGAEGLDLKRVRHIHIMEPYWNYGRIAQVMARGIRNDSHKGLPDSEKNVATYIYLAIAPADEKTAGITTDMELYEDSVNDRALIASFIQAVDEVSIECMLNGEPHCRSCNPTGAKLFSTDAFRDSRMDDPCKPIEETTLTAKSITIDGKEYFYTPSDSIFGYSVYAFDPDVNAHRPVKESDPMFMRIIDTVNAGV